MTLFFVFFDATFKKVANFNIVYIKMYKFRDLFGINNFATQDAMDYLIRHINQRTDNLLEDDRGEDGLYQFVLNKYNQDRNNVQYRKAQEFNSLNGIYNYLYRDEQEGDERDPRVWVNPAHLGKKGGSRRKKGGSRRKRLGSSRKRHGKRRHSHL